MSVHSETVVYCWTSLDRLAAVSEFPGTTLTPYELPHGSISDAARIAVGSKIELPLGATENPAAVARFFREGYEWVPVPEDVPLAGTLGALFERLYAKDKVRFGHFDPLQETVLAAARNMANLPGMGPTALLDPTLLPMGALAQLHFQYWGNTELHAKLIGGTVKTVEVDLKVLTLVLPWFGSNPMAAPLASLVPLAIPTEKDGKKLERVLARKARTGTPIRAVPRAVGANETKCTSVVSIPPPRLELDGFSPQVLKPLRVDEWTLRASKVRFLLTLAVPAARVTFEILHGSAVYYTETHEYGEYLLPGTHSWSWDGYDLHGVLDTRLLRQNDLSARVTTVDLAGRRGVATVELGTGPDKIRWVDVKVVSAERLLDLTVYARFSSPSEVQIGTLRVPLPELPGGSVGTALSAAGASLGALPGAGLVPLLPGMSELPALPGVPPLLDVLKGDELRLAVHLPDILDLEPEKFGRFKQSIRHGIGKYWSRTVRLSGQTWTLRVSCQERVHDAVRTFLVKALPKALQDLGIGDGSDFAQGFGSRSVNLATFMEGLPIIDVWEDTDSDEVRAETGAHELGHSVLRDFRSFYYSLTHKGTSTIGQGRLPDGPVYPPSPAEIDVMYYPREGASKPEDWVDRTIASEEDALGLVSMARVVFG